MNIERVADNLKDNAVPLLLGVGGVCVLLSLLTGKESESELVPATGYTSYPDAVTNANVIIGEVNDHTTAEVGNLKDQHESLMDTLLGQNDFYKESLETVLGKADTSTEEVMGAIGNVQTSVNNVQQSVNNVQQSVNKVQTSVDNVNKNVTTQSSIIQNAVNKVQETVKKATTTTAKKATTTTKKTTSSGTYTYKTKAGLNTSTSIVDALKATGVDSSMSYRKKIAKANGISNYTGTASQNVALLNKLKAGTLKKV